MRVSAIIPRFLFQNVRAFTSPSSSNAEQKIHQVLQKRFEDADVKVVDVSGGCGAMFEVYVESKEFVGLNTLKQHKLVTNTLKAEIKEMHGVRIQTAIKSQN